MKKKGYILLISVLMTFILSSCGNDENEEEGISEYKIYYINNDQTKLVTEPYNAEAEETSDLVKELLDQNPTNLSYKKALPTSVIIDDILLVDSDQVTINFSSSYLTLSGIGEILCRAAVVRTLCQISGIEYVEFTVEGQPLLDKDEKPIGSMKNDSFVVLDNNADYSQDARFYLYFTNIKKEKLVATRVKVTYDGSKSLQQLAVEYLIEGPTIIKGLGKTLNSTLPKNTKVNSVTTNKKGICIVDLSDGFLVKDPDIKDNLVVYSIVNTLIELKGVKKVQFLIDGKKKKTYGDIKDFDLEFDRNLDIIKD